MKRILFASLFMSILWGCNTTKTTQTMNLKALHTETKDVQTHLLFKPTDEKVISLQIAKGKQLKEHVSKVPPLLVCVSGKAIYSDENGTKETLEAGNYVLIEPNVLHKVDAIKESNFLLIK